ncbi:MAG: hypothetical protein AMXMBFR4_28730 [Candidatus Hydrogenedentota bacterium]
MIDYPDFHVAAESCRNRINTDLHGTNRNRHAGGDVVEIEHVRGGIADGERGAVRTTIKWVNLRGLEIDKRCMRRRGRKHYSDSKKDSASTSPNKHDAPTLLPV